MADNKDLRGWSDLARLAAREEYEVQAFADRHGMTPAEVREMIERIGDDRDALQREAAKLRRH